MKQGKFNRKFIIDKADDNGKKKLMKPKQWIKSSNKFNDHEMDKYFNSNLSKEYSNCDSDENVQKESEQNNHNIPLETNENDVTEDFINSNQHDVNEEEESKNIEEIKKRVFFKQTPSKTTLDSNDLPQKKIKSESQISSTFIIFLNLHKAHVLREMKILKLFSNYRTNQNIAYKFIVILLFVSSFLYNLSRGVYYVN